MFDAFIKETTTAPGTSVNCSLNGATAPFRSFASVFSTGTVVFYFMEDSSQAEWGYGTLTTGSPHQLARTTVLGNTAGNTSRLNFLGTTKIYSQIPPTRLPYLDQNGVFRAPGGFRQNLSALVRLTADQSIAHATHAAISWSSASFDDATIWSAGSPTRLTVPTGFSRARLVTNVMWPAASGGIRRLGFRLNGSTGVGLGWTQITTPSASIGEYQNFASAVLSCAAGDYFEVFVFQGSGGSLNLVGTGTTETWASIELIR